MIEPSFWVAKIIAILADGDSGWDSKKLMADPSNIAIKVAIKCLIKKRKMNVASSFLLLIIVSIVQAVPTKGKGIERAFTTIFAHTDCYSHWEDDQTVGFLCTTETRCRAALLMSHTVANCWGSCDDKKYYCKRSTLETDHFFMSEGPEGPGCCIQ